MIGNTDVQNEMNSWKECEDGIYFKLNEIMKATGIYILVDKGNV